MPKFSEKRICDNCEKEYYAKNAKQRFCSSACQVSSMKKGDFIIYERDEFRCTYCGKTSYEDGVSLNVDHIIPVFDGGDDIAGNLTTSCSSCNVQKGKKRLDSNILKELLNTVSKRNLKFGIRDDQRIKFHITSKDRRNRAEK